MSSFMDRLTGRKPTPAQSAKDRLKFVLVTDRTTISPEDLRKMQDEILDVIRKYCRINEDAVDMKFEQRDRENYLVADIPLASARLDDPVGSVRIETTISTSDEEKTEVTVKDEKPAAEASSKPDDEEATQPTEVMAGLNTEQSESDAPASDEGQKKEDE